MVHKVKTIGLQLEDLESKDFIFAVAGGQSKGEAIKAYLYCSRQYCINHRRSCSESYFTIVIKSLILFKYHFKGGHYNGN